MFHGSSKSNPQRTAASWQGLGFPSGRVFLAPLLVLGTALLVFAQAKPDTEPQPQTITTKDGVPLKITYYPSVRGKEAAVVILVHMKDGNRFVWKDFAERLQREEFAVVTVDLRGHGESRPAAASGAKTATLRPADYAAMVAADMEAVKKFIYDMHQEEKLNMNKTGIVGAEMGATIAAFWAAADWAKTPHSDGIGEFRTPRGQDVRAIALISPQTNISGLAIQKPLTYLGDPAFNIAFLIAWGEKVGADRTTGTKMFDLISKAPDSTKRMFKEGYDAKLKGTELMGKQLKLEDHMSTFFTKFLRDIPSEWRDRKSKLED